MRPIVTLVVPIKGEIDVLRYNTILRPSIDGLRGCELLVITDEDISDESTEHLNVRVISDDYFDIKRKMSGWNKQQVLKLKSWRLVNTPWILTLDADCVFLFSGHISLLMPQGRPCCSWSGPLKGEQEKWWDKAASILNKPKPDIRCSVTPMFLNVNTCKKLDLEFDVADCIMQGATEYSLYWMAHDCLSDYSINSYGHPQPMIFPGHAYWKYNNECPLEWAARVFNSIGRIGVLQSNINLPERWANNSIGFVNELASIYKSRPSDC